MGTVDSSLELHVKTWNFQIVNGKQLAITNNLSVLKRTT